MKSIIVAAMLTFVSFTTFAIYTPDAPPVTQTTPAQREEIVRDLINSGQWDAAKRVLNKGQETAPTPESIPIEKRVLNNATEWATLGTNLGSALVATSKELGMAAAEFANTPLGRVTTAILAYKIIGKDIIRTIFAAIIFVAGLLILPKIYQYCMYSSIEYEFRPIFWGLTDIRRIKTAKIYNSDGEFAGFGAYLGMLVAFIVVCLATLEVLPY
jgi:hypothetical protein